MIYGYARVSTQGQSLEAQVETLKAAGCDKIFQEKITGARADRPQLKKLLANVRAGDLVLATRNNRFARNARDLLNSVSTIVEAGALYRSLAEPWADTGTPMGRFFLTVLAGVDELDREMIIERTSDGRARAKARGQSIGGRPRALSPHQRQEALERLAKGETLTNIARSYGVNISTISRLRP